MISTAWIRLAVVAAALLGTVFLGVKTLLATLPIDPVFAPVVFPRETSVAGWLAVIEEPDPVRPQTQRYRRTAGDATVSLEMQFIPDLPVHYVRNPQIELRFLPRAHLPLDAGMRYYVSPRAQVVPNQRSGQSRDLAVVAGPEGSGFWTVDETAHLSTIVTPAGDTSIDPRTVAHSLYLDHLTAGRIARWLFTREPLPDRRCVLIHFSTADGPAARATLEQSWTEWRAAHFPVFPGAAR